MSKLMMKVPLNRLGKLEAMLSRRLRDDARKAMEKAARQIIPVLIARTLDAPPASDSPRSVPGAYASQKMAQGWRTRPLPSVLKYEIYNEQPYAPYQNFGVLTNTAKIPMSAVDNFVVWMGQRGIVVLDERGAPMEITKGAKRIILAMNRRTKWRIKPRRIVERARNRASTIFKDRLRDAMERAIREVRNR